MDKPNITSVTFNLGPWMRRREEGGWRVAEGRVRHDEGAGNRSRDGLVMARYPPS